MKRLALAALLGAAALTPAPTAAAIVFGSDPILFWNTIALANLPGSAPVQTRAYAMLNVAMHDAVNAALGKPNQGYLPGVAALGGDVRAAASQAAYHVLSALNTTPCRAGGVPAGVERLPVRQRRGDAGAGRRDGRGLCGRAARGAGC
jgi:hypothetical protein